MSHSFIAYIDESGDDGLGNYRAIGAQGGASSWLVISACVSRYVNDSKAVGWRNDILAKTGKRSPHLHFADLKHEQKLVAAQRLSKLPVRAMSVLANKVVIPDGIYTNQNQLYFYQTRYLIERISWFCRDYRRLVRDGDGRVKIVFSRRGGMSYPDFCAYLERLRADTSGAVQIHWPVIDIDGIDARDHKSYAGLQLADSVASAFAAGLECDRFGNCECRYAEILRPSVYCRNGNYFSYGVKLVPKLDDMTLSEDQMRFVSLFE